MLVAYVNDIGQQLCQNGTRDTPPHLYYRHKTKRKSSCPDKDENLGNSGQNKLEFPHFSSTKRGVGSPTPLKTKSQIHLISYGSYTESSEKILFAP